MADLMDHTAALTGGDQSGDLWVHVVDDGDTADSAEGTDKRIKLVGKQEIATIDNMSTAGKFDFTGLSLTDAKRVIIEGMIRSDVAAVTDRPHMYYNADTTNTNYRFQSQYGASTGSNGVAANDPRLHECAAASAPEASTNFSPLRIEIPFPGRTDNHKYAKVFTGYWYGAATIADVTGIHLWSKAAGDAAITQITIEADGDPTDELFGILTLYVEY